MNLINIESSASTTAETLLSYCSTSDSVYDLHTRLYWYYVGGQWVSETDRLDRIYDAVVSTTEELENALTSTTVESIFVRVKLDGNYIQLGLLDQNRTYNIGHKKKIYGDIFEFGFDNAYDVYLNCGLYSIEIRNIQVNIRCNVILDTTIGRPVYIKKVRVYGLSTLTGDHPSRLLIEHIEDGVDRVDGYKLIMWDSMFDTGDVDILDNQILKYNASTGKWIPTTVASLTIPIIDRASTMDLATVTSESEIYEPTTTNNYSLHLTKLQLKGNMEISTQTIIQTFFNTTDNNATVNWAVVIYKDNTTYPNGLSTLSLVAHTAFSSTQFDGITLFEGTIDTFIESTLYGNKDYFIGVMWKKTGAIFKLLGNIGLMIPANKANTPTVAGAIRADNITSQTVPPTIARSGVVNIQEDLRRHYFTIINRP